MSHIMDHFLSSSNLLLKYRGCDGNILWPVYTSCMSEYYYYHRLYIHMATQKLIIEFKIGNKSCAGALLGNDSFGRWSLNLMMRQTSELTAKGDLPRNSNTCAQKLTFNLSYTQREIKVPCHATKLQYGHVIIKAQWHNVRHVLSTSCSHPWRREPRWASLVPPMRLVASIATFIVFFY